MIPCPDGVSTIWEEGSGERLQFSVRGIRLRFSRDEFYEFVVLVLDAEAPFRKWYCDHGRRLEEGTDAGGELVLSEKAGFGRIYECEFCYYIHVDIGTQRLVVAPGAFSYFMSLIRKSAADVEWLHPPAA